MALQTTQQTVSPPIFYGELMSKGVFPALNQEFQNLLTSDQTPYNFDQPRIASFTPDQLQAMELARGGVGSYLPGMTAAQNLLGGSLNQGSNLIQTGVQQGVSGTQEAQNILRDMSGGFNPTDTARFYNPYEDAVVNRTLSDLQDQFDVTQNQLNNQAIQSGAFGGSRGRIMGDELAKSFGRGAAEAVGGIRRQGFSDAMANAQAAFKGRGTVAGGLGSLSGNLANIGIAGGGDLINTMGRGASALGNINTGIYNLMGGDINRLSSLGAQQQGLQQRGLDMNYANYAGSLNYPMNVIRDPICIASGIAQTLGRNLYQDVEDISDPEPAPNKFMQLAGTGLQLYGLMNDKDTSSLESLFSK